MSVAHLPHRVFDALSAPPTPLAQLGVCSVRLVPADVPVCFDCHGALTELRGIQHCDACRKSWRLTRGRIARVVATRIPWRSA